ncbi:MAG: family 16 glycoside hydrolase [Isosphaerales bacterium]
MKTWSLMTSGFALAGLLLSPLYAGDDAKRTWTFDDDETGAIAKGFTNDVGEWKVAASDKGKALAQSAKNPNSVFNVTLISDTNAKDVDLSVRMKAIAGEHDQGGGLVWRAKDAKNYYLVRYNPLEDNYRLYHVVNGKRTLIQNVDITHSDGWNTLRVTMTGDQITCYYDGKKSIEAKDSTLPEAGKIGLWSKADAQSEFDDLTLTTR